MEFMKVSYESKEERLCEASSNFDSYDLRGFQKVVDVLYVSVCQVNNYCKLKCFTNTNARNSFLYVLIESSKRYLLNTALLLVCSLQ